MKVSPDLKTHTRPGPRRYEFPSSLVPLFQNESNCETIQMKMSWDLHENEFVGGAHVHVNCFPLRLA